MSRTEIVIERLVLDGLALGSSEVAALRAALEAELVGRFGGAGAVDASGDRVGEDARARSRAVDEHGPAGLGRAAALAIHRSVRR